MSHLFASHLSRSMKFFMFQLNSGFDFFNHALDFLINNFRLVSLLFVFTSFVLYNPIFMTHLSTKLVHKNFNS